MNYAEYIEVNPEKRFGRPVIIGTRISVKDVISWLADGLSVDDIISDFPEPDEAQIKACLSYNSEHGTDETHDL
jgi:uncharacterized protein (DUF433 family)